MDAIIHHAGPLRGSVTLPPDKAICHRAVLLAALAEGETTIRPWPSAEDCQHTLRIIQQLGIPVRQSSALVQIRGRGLRGLQAPASSLWCGESGTTLRLAAGILAGQPFSSQLTAGPSLSHRPMRRIVEPLAQMGARLEGAAGADESAECVPPLTIYGRSPLQAIRYEMPVASAQVKSAILFAALFAEGRSAVIEPQETRDHTERLLRACGVRVQRDGRCITIEPRQIASPGELALPGDFSSAAFFLVAASCVSGSRLTLHDVSLNPTRIRALEALIRMGARITSRMTQDGWEPRGTMTVERSPLHGLMLDAAQTPGLIDELPILMVAAACAQGTSRFEGLSELRVKETDRVRSLVEGLQRLGAAVRVPARDTVELDGGALRGADVESAGDHRTAMSLAVAGLIAQGTTTIRAAECIAKSFPEFFDCLRAVAGSSTVQTIPSAQRKGFKGGVFY